MRARAHKLAGKGITVQHTIDPVADMMVLGDARKVAEKWPRRSRGQHQRTNAPTHQRADAPTNDRETKEPS
ncbi:hypothetical protein D8B29_18285 [Verminephrobacter eiseniae]|nr:hypothetical protein [Verminephrobacter eiseniae]MCW5302740.1 hypothetical protein [Verminephrobacter eiseniae]MCW8181464.1 hypothetical protein [Verminephrobacter eiseniae]MCW8192802.1 hypothetical protein [Verminephrobacter eiseniae]